MYDCYTHGSTGVFTECYVTQLDSHDCAVFKARVVSV